MKVIACGEALFSSRNLAQRLDPKLIALLRGADAVFSNAEFCTPEPSTPPAPGRGYTTSVRPATLDEFNALNIRLLSFVNNHTCDYGWQGVVDTIRAAESRGLIQCGLGMDLDDARLPRFLDTAAGRVGVVAAASTRAELFLASNGGGGAPPRPGSNPLRWGHAYVLPEQEYEQLRRIDELLGTAASAREGLRVETWAPWPEGTFHFGSMYEQNLTIERGAKAYVRTWLNEVDERELLKSVRDAAARSDFNLFSLHTHEGENENWYGDYAPEFVEKIAHEAIDAGADAVVGHGAHFVRGVEIYRGKPIFYNLGCLLMEFEAGGSIIPPEMYEAYGYAHDERPSTLHGNRAKDRAGRFIGFNAERRFSEHVMVKFEDDGSGAYRFSLIPLDLGMDRENPLQRGLPRIADAGTAEHLTAEINRRSERYGTTFVYDPENGVIRLKEEESLWQHQ